MMWRLCGLVVMLSIVACQPTRVQAGTRLGVAESPEIGRYLSDETGRAVFVLLADPKGASTCADDCAAAWPPVPASEPLLEAREPAIQTELVGSIMRADGIRQLTYSTRALYYRDADIRSPVERSVIDRWGQWSLVFPPGEPMIAPQ